MKAAIFDWDGTLVDTFPVAIGVFKQVLGEDFTEKDLKAGFGSGVEGVIKMFFDGKGTPYDDEKIKELATKKTEIQTGLASKTKILGGVFELLEYLKNKDYKMAISTSNHSPIVNSVLEEHKLQNYFDVIITADNVKVKRLKPYPDAFLLTAEKLDLSPEECVVFEDSPHGIEAAKRAGMKVIGVCTGPFNKEELLTEEADLVIDSLNQLETIGEFLRKC